MNDNTIQRTAMRRRDRAVNDDAWISAMLRETAVASIAVADEGEPYINTNIFYYDPDEHAIYLHTASQGKLRSAIERSGRVCLSLFALGRFLPASTALEFSVEYEGVVVFGTATIVTDEAEAYRALDNLLHKYAPHLEPERDYRPSTSEEIHRTSVYRIAVEEWSGKRKQVEPDFPGAFIYAPPGG
jgi:nitroimidazol reductase NimA-like FMN-containing flavoprotein (pyridoxamine 5'-phosphate oxidase superfamily)